MLCVKSAVVQEFNKMATKPIRCQYLKIEEACALTLTNLVLIFLLLLPHTLNQNEAG